MIPGEPGRKNRILTIENLLSACLDSDETLKPGKELNEKQPRYRIRMEQRHNRLPDSYYHDNKMEKLD